VSASLRRTQTYLTQNERSVPPLLTLHNFVCPEHHTLAQTCDQKRICHGQQREILTERDFLCVQEDNGLVGQRRKRCVDATDRVRDTTSDFVRLGRLQCDLDKDDLWRGHE
jgi:hypothetical protein